MVAVEPGSDAARLGVCRGWMLHAVNGDVVCTAFAVHSMPLANYLLEAHGGARGRSTGFAERTRAGFEPHGVCGACGPVPTDRGRRARGAAQRGAASLRRLAQARADLQGSSTPPLAAHLCSMKARAIIWPLPVWRSYFRGMIRSKWCVVPFTSRCFDAYSILRAEGSSSFADE